MQTTDNQRRFADYYQLANRMIDLAEKDTLGEVAKILAIYIARYRAKFGTMSMEETLRLLHADTLTDEEVGTAADGMEYLSVLAVAAGLVDDEPGPLISRLAADLSLPRPSSSQSAIHKNGRGALSVGLFLDLMRR